MPQAPNLLTVGTPVPDISLTDQDGHALSLRDFQGQKVILFIYPRDDSETCLKEALNLKEGYESLRAAGYEVLGLSPDKASKHRKYIDKRDLPFSLIADPEHQLIEAFGAWGEKELYGRVYVGVHRSTFLIDEGGRIAHVIYPVKSGQHTQQILDLDER